MGAMRTSGRVAEIAEQSNWHPRSLLCDLCVRFYTHPPTIKSFNCAQPTRR